MSDNGMIVAPEDAGDLIGMDTQSLLKELSASIEMTLRGLVRTAYIVRTLEERGEDLSGLRLGILGYLRQIAYGQVLPQVVLKFGEFPLLVKRVAALPLPDQLRLVESGSVELVVRRENGFDHYQASLLGMTMTQIYQVFDRDHVRTIGEQRLLLEAQVKKPPKRTVSRGKLRVDRQRGCLTFGRSLIDPQDALRALADLGGSEEPDEGEASQSLVIRLSEAEHRRLKMAAARGDASMTDLVRDALRAAGLI